MPSSMMGGMFGRDPFKNDPFFADSGFGGMDQMMKQMQQSAMTMNMAR